MKPLYILSPYSDADVRRQRASLDEIRAILAKRSNDRLAHIAIDEDGDIIATPLRAEELTALAADLDREVEAQLRSVLDAAVTLAKLAGHLDGVSIGSFGAISIWVDRCPTAERVVPAWAEERGFEFVRSSPPRTSKRWYPDAIVKVSGHDAVRLIWDEIEVNTEAAVEKEIVGVTSERNTAARELEAF